MEYDGLRMSSGHLTRRVPRPLDSDRPPIESGATPTAPALAMRCQPRGPRQPLRDESALSIHWHCGNTCGPAHAPSRQQPGSRQSLPHEASGHPRVVLGQQGKFGGDVGGEPGGHWTGLIQHLHQGLSDPLQALPDDLRDLLLFLSLGSLPPASIDLSTASRAWAGVSAPLSTSACSTTDWRVNAAVAMPRVM